MSFSGDGADDTADHGDRQRQRGYVDIHGDRLNGFVVYDWSEHGDSGYCIDSARTWPEAVRIAKAWAREHNRRLPEAEIVPFPGGAT